MAKISLVSNVSFDWILRIEQLQGLENSYLWFYLLELRESRLVFWKGFLGLNEFHWSICVHSDLQVPNLLHMHFWVTDIDISSLGFPMGDRLRKMRTSESLELQHLICLQIYLFGVGEMNGTGNSCFWSLSPSILSSVLFIY